MKESKKIAIFFLVFLIMLLVCVSAASVYFAVASCNNDVVPMMVVLFMIAACTLSLHLVSTFTPKGIDHEIIDKVATVFMVLFLIFFVAGIIYYYLQRPGEIDEPVQMETMETYEEEVVAPFVQEESSTPVIPETEPVPEPMAEEIVEVPISSVQAVPKPPSICIAEASVAPRVPTAPSFDSVPGPAKIPARAELSYFSFLHEEQDVSEDDFWADFFIAGEDELILDDGLYYMNLNVNDVYVGVVATMIDQGAVYINNVETQGYVSGYLTEIAQLRIFGISGEFIGLDYLEECGVETRFDSSAYEIFLYFNNEDMPVRIININSIGKINQFRPVYGATLLSPALFVLSSDYSLYLSSRGSGFDEIGKSLGVGLYVSNALRIGSVYGKLSYSFDYSSGKIGFSLGSYSMYTDFADGLYRLSWGNVSSDELSPTGTTIGVQLTKNRLSLDKRKSQIEESISVESRSEVTIYNEGREIYRKTLDAGNYLLRDFVLYTGANRIKIVIEPLDGSPPREMELNINFSSSLLAPGEMTWNVGLYTGRRIVDSSSSAVKGAIRLPWFGSRSFEYDLRNLVLSGAFDIGILENLSLSASMGVKNEVTATSGFNMLSSGSFELTHANVLGTTKYNVSVSEKIDSSGFSLPDMNLRLSHQLYTNWTPVSVFNASVAYNCRFSDSSVERQTLSLSSSLSGRIGFFGWNLSGYYNWGLDAVSRDLWMLSTSVSIPLGNKVSFSGSMSYAGNEDSVGRLYGSIGMSVRFGTLSVSASSDIVNNTTFNVSAGKGRHYFHATAGIGDWRNLSRNSYGANYSYSGNLFDFGLNVATYNGLDGLSYSFNLGFTSLFADGLFTFVPSTPSNFVLISQKGSLKGNDLSVGIVGSSYSEEIETIFGVGIYSGISLGNPASLSVFSLNPEAFSGAVGFDITIPESDLAGYVIVLESEDTYVYSGIVSLPDGSIYANASSPVYRITADVDGVMALEQCDYYLFTDESGRFILSDLCVGSYAFDVLYENSWYLVTFDVVEHDNAEGVQIVSMVGPYVDDFSLSPYSGNCQMAYQDTLSSDDFWMMLYPQEEVL